DERLVTLDLLRRDVIGELDRRNTHSCSVVEQASEIGCCWLSEQRAIGAKPVATQEGVEAPRMTRVGKATPERYRIFPDLIDDDLQVGQVRRGAPVESLDPVALEAGAEHPVIEVDDHDAR